MIESINVLGTEYKIKIVTEKIDDEFIAENNYCGYCDFKNKMIVILKESDFNDKKTFKHELVHAFLYESGLHANSIFALNETLVDWIALQLEKIYNASILY